MKDIGFGDSIVDEAYRIAIMSVDDEGNLDLEKIEKGFLELRSRQHPAPAHQPLPCYDCVSSKEAIARKAREDVLKELELWVRPRYEHWADSFDTDRDPYLVVLNKLQSLRSTQHPGQEERG